MTDQELNLIIQNCIKGKQDAQKALYKAFYGLGMGICLRYATAHEEAQEILNDSFLKVFSHLEVFESEKAFKQWFKRIVINTCIDFFRRRQKYANTEDLSYAEEQTENINAIDTISEQEILQMVQQLPDSYKLVFNLFAIEGYKHEEIADMLGIQVGTSKSNLAKARKWLQDRIMRFRD